MPVPEVLSLPDAASVAFAARVAELASRLGAAQSGESAAVEVLEGDASGEFVLTTPSDVPAGTAAVIRTSGSTGMPKRTALPAASLAASAAATREHLGGDGHWLLALPLHYVAGLAVLSRALLGTTASGPARLATMDLTAHFSVDAFAAATTLLRQAVGPDELLYTSVVPTQLTRLLDSAPGIAALREYHAVLVGGGRTPDTTRAAATQAGAPVVYTYGSAETCGGCVYDGVPLPGVRVEAVDGRLRLGGAVVAAGYLADPERTAEHFLTGPDGTPWYVTDDLGSVSDGRVSVAGRVDDVINTGGVKVSAQAVQRLIESVPGVADALVIGVPDPEWGQRVGLGWQGTPVATAPDAAEPGPAEKDTTARILAAVRAELGAAAVPRVVEHYARLPRLGNGKPDRRRIGADLAARAAAPATSGTGTRAEGGE